MSLSEIVDMDEVPDRGAVRGEIVRSIDLDAWVGPEGGAQDVRNQVRLGVVILAEVITGARHVEIAEAHRPDPVRPAEVADHPVDRQLRAAIGHSWASSARSRVS